MALRCEKFSEWCSLGCVRKEFSVYMVFCLLLWFFNYEAFKNFCMYPGLSLFFLLSLREWLFYLSSYLKFMSFYLCYTFWSNLLNDSVLSSKGSLLMSLSANKLGFVLKAVTEYLCLAFYMKFLWFVTDYFLWCDSLIWSCNEILFFMLNSCLYLLKSFLSNISVFLTYDGNFINLYFSSLSFKDEDSIDLLNLKSSNKNSSIQAVSHFFIFLFSNSF